MRSFLGLMATCVVILSCSNSSEDVVLNKVESRWDKNSVQHFQFEIKDAQQPKNIIFVVRNNDDYPYSNLRVISSLNKKGTINSKPDTLNFVLAQPNGEWLGKGFGGTKEIMFLYKADYRFPADGSYTVDVVQAMRKDMLPGIEDFGVKIVNAKP